MLALDEQLDLLRRHGSHILADGTFNLFKDEGLERPFVLWTFMVCTFCLVLNLHCRSLFKAWLFLLCLLSLMANQKKPTGRWFIKFMNLQDVIGFCWLLLTKTAAWKPTDWYTDYEIAFTNAIKHVDPQTKVRGLFDVL